jgi:peptidoglycan hydrolase-like protein with peptidoglycan-binding domain
MPNDNRYTLEAQLLGYDKTNPDMAVCALRLVSPDGEIVGEYHARSGPYGKGAFPGLHNEFKNVFNFNNVNAIFKVHCNDEDMDRTENKFKKSNGKNGFFVWIETPIITGRFELGIHHDNPPLGTEGCFGLVEGDDIRFITDLTTTKDLKPIPAEQRPTELKVLKPNLQDAISLNLSFTDLLFETDLTKKPDTFRINNSLLLIGSKGAEVENLEKSMIALGFLKNENAVGKFDAKTKQAVIEFQEAFGLKADGNGIVGPETFGKLKEIATEVSFSLNTKNVSDVAFVNTYIDTNFFKTIADNLATGLEKNSLTKSHEYAKYANKKANQDKPRN